MHSIAAAFVLTAAVNPSRCCRFADRYSTSDFDDKEKRTAFITEAVWAEREFYAKPFVGYDAETGWTFDGINLDSEGRIQDPITAPRVFTAPSKESLQLGLLALSIPLTRASGGLPFPYTEAEAQALLQQKAEAYEAFNANYPTFGGWLPWLCSRGSVDGKCAGLDQPAGPAAPVYSNQTLPGVDNGEYAWAIYTVARAARANADVTKSVPWAKIASTYEALLSKLRESAVRIWLENPPNSTARVCETVVLVEGKSSCAGVARLNDPFEGELLVLFLDLFGDWAGIDKEKATQSLWQDKQTQVVTAELYGVKVQKGWHFSSHEQWKMLMLPYLDLPKTREILADVEVARTRYSLITGVPGLVAAANEPMPDDHKNKPRPGCPGGYCKAVGVAPLAQAPILVNWTTSPYAAFPLTLVDPAAGLSWYNSMLRTPRMQTMHGGGESASTDGQEVSTALTWDTKTTMLIAMYGGLGPLVRPFLEADGVFDTFKSRVEGMYLTAFGPVHGDQQLPGRPHMLAPANHCGYASCQCSLIRTVVSVFLPICGLFVAMQGGDFMGTMRVVTGAVAGAIPGAKLNFIYAISLCRWNPKPEGLKYCYAVDDPVASAVLLGLFGAILGAKSIKFTLVMLVAIDAAIALALISLALPVGPRVVLFSMQSIATVLSVTFVLSLGCLCSRIYRTKSRALTTFLSALLGAGMLTVAIWSFEDLDVFDPVWAGSDEGYVAPVLVWLALTVLSVWWQFYGCCKGAHAHAEDRLGDCEGVREARFHKSNSLPDVRSAELSQTLLNGNGRMMSRENMLGSTGSLANFEEDRMRSVPDLQRLQAEARAAELAQQQQSIDVGAGFEGGLPIGLPSVSQSRDVFQVEDRRGAEGLLAPHKETAGAILYLWCSVLLTLFLTAILPFTIDWLTTNLIIGLIYCMLNWFLLWNVTDMFISVIAYHVVRLIWGFSEVPRQDLLSGIPDSARTLIQFCLLSSDIDTSAQTWENAYACYLQNLDPNGNIAVCLVSVSNKLSVVEAEVECCQSLQLRFLQQIQVEMDGFLKYAEQVAWPPPLEEVCPPATAERGHFNRGLVDRWYFWTGLANKVHSEQSVTFKGARVAMQTQVEAMAKNICYFHRNSRVLKKPGQYQDMIILASTGDNKAYTYTDPAYGKLGRPAESSCFGFTGNMVNDTGADFQRAIKKLQKKGEVHVQRMKREGQLNPYRYSMVMDSDTASGWRSVLRLIEYAVVNPTHGIFQPALALDDQAAGQTWYMWAESLRQASNVNLPKAHFTIFRRHGFYGKGLFDNQMMIDSVIGRRPEPEADGSYRPIEALPVDIMSHDTFEAKILKPCFVPDVKLREEPAKNAISAFPQTTRWMTGEVRNASYPPGLFRSGITLSQRIYGFFHGEAPRPPFIRQYDIPVAWSTDYISHISFRVMHAGPAIMLIILLRNYCAHMPGMLTFRNNFLALPLTLFTLISLFVLPKGLLVLDMIPSLGLSRRWRVAGLEYVPSADAPRPPPPRKGSACAQFLSKLLLSLVEAVLSALIFGPECLVGLHRMLLSYSSQITGKVAWKPQAAVDKEVEEQTTGSFCQRFRFVVSNVWHIPALGLLIAATTLMMDVFFEPFSIVLWVSWIVHPFVVVWGCSACPEPEKSFWVRLVRKTVAADEN
jgi:hypothetical protein